MCRFYWWWTPRAISHLLSKEVVVIIFLRNLYMNKYNLQAPCQNNIQCCRDQVLYYQVQSNIILMTIIWKHQSSFHWSDNTSPFYRQLVANLFCHPDNANQEIYMSEIKKKCALKSLSHSNSPPPILSTRLTLSTRLPGTGKDLWESNFLQ